MTAKRVSINLLSRPTTGTVNFLSCMWTTFAAIPYMLRDGGGTVVNVSSFAAEVSPPREALYAASKAAMNAFSLGLWNDLAGSATARRSRRASGTAEA